MTELIEFQTVTAGPYSAVTGLSASTSVFAEAWARITETAGGRIENVSQQERVARKAFEICIRHIDGIDAFMQIKWGGRFLIMMAPPQLILDKYNRRWLAIQAEETAERGV